MKVKFKENIELQLLIVVLLRCKYFLSKFEKSYSGLYDLDSEFRRKYNLFHDNDLFLREFIYFKKNSFNNTICNRTRFFISVYATVDLLLGTNLESDSIYYKNWSDFFTDKIENMSKEELNFKHTRNFVSRNLNRRLKKFINLMEGIDSPSEFIISIMEFFIFLYEMSNDELILPKYPDTISFSKLDYILNFKSKWEAEVSSIIDVFTIFLSTIFHLSKKRNRKFLFDLSIFEFCSKLINYERSYQKELLSKLREAKNIAETHFKKKYSLM